MQDLFTSDYKAADGDIDCAVCVATVDPRVCLAW
jgi:hypothetical protein